MTTLSCNFPGCEAKDLKPETALVPAIKAIQQAENGRPVSPAILASHVFCQEHGALGRSQAGGARLSGPGGELAERRFAANLLNCRYVAGLLLSLKKSKICFCEKK